ncbi:MAG: hypothetical protein KGQ37_02950 [Hyphomicrobiales bacterium]|nr:hypothetical protein [Hyphomicrobiales bacterium]
MNIMDTRLQDHLKTLAERQQPETHYRPSVAEAWEEANKKPPRRSGPLLIGGGVLAVAVVGLSALLYSGRQLSVRLQLEPPGHAAVAAASAARPVVAAPATGQPTDEEEKAAMARLSAELAQHQQATSAAPAPLSAPAPAAAAAPPPAAAGQHVKVLSVQRVPLGQAAAAPAPAPAPVAAAPAAPAISEADAMTLAHRASDLIQQGQIAGARVLLERAQGAHDPKIDFALAETYDPNQLNRWKVLGMVADPARARSLYQKAADGGMEEARARMAALPAR